MEGALRTAEGGYQRQPIGFANIPDLVAAIRFPTGANCRVMAVVLRWMLQHGAEREHILVPNHARLARELGLPRQSVSQASAALAKRGLICTTPLKGPNGPRWVRARPIAPVQFSLFAGPG